MIDNLIALFCDCDECTKYHDRRGAPREDTMSETTAASKPAFRCRNCGRLHAAEHAGENFLPHSCDVCSRGVVFGKDLDECLAHEHLKEHAAALVANRADHDKSFLEGGRTHPVVPGHLVKFMHYENWEVLADATPERLEELGLSPDTVERHVPKIPEADAKKRTPKLVNVVFTEAQDFPGTTDGINQ